MNADEYSYSVRWSVQDEAFLGTVLEFPSLSWLDDSQTAALTGIRDVVADVLDDMAENGESIPEAIANRHYSGKFMVRVAPEVHRDLVLKAAEQHVSLNRYVSSRLA